MKNYVRNLFKVLFVSLLLASCSEQEMLVDEPQYQSQAEFKTYLEEDDYSLSERASNSECYAKYDSIVKDYTGTNTIKDANVNESEAVGFLFDQRVYVAYYRLYCYVYTDYIKRGKTSLTRKNVTDLGKSRYQKKAFEILEKYYFDILKKSVLKAASAGSNDIENWTALVEYLTTINDGRGIRHFTRASNEWDGEDSKHGSYGIFFKDDKFYIGKGGGKARMRRSAVEKCIKNDDEATYAEYQNTSLDYLNGQLKYNDDKSRSRQAYKEETVKMYLSGFRSKNIKPAKMLNEIQSKGLNYIVQDGY